MCQSGKFAQNGPEVFLREKLAPDFLLFPQSKLISQGEDELVVSVWYSWSSRLVEAIAVVFSV